jgi:hypothetical protein
MSGWDDDSSPSMFKFESKHVSDGATVTLNCCSCIIPVTLISCGAVLVANPNQIVNYQGILIAYYIIGALTLISSLCQFCCITLAQCGSFLNCCCYFEHLCYSMVANVFLLYSCYWTNHVVFRCYCFKCKSYC